MSDTFYPEFGSALGTARVEEAIRDVLDLLEIVLGTERRPIADVVAEPAGTHVVAVSFTPRDLQVIRFALSRSLRTMRPGEGYVAPPEGPR